MRQLIVRAGSACPLFAKLAAFGLALALTFGCSSGDDGGGSNSSDSNSNLVVSSSSSIASSTPSSSSVTSSSSSSIMTYILTCADVPSIGKVGTTINPPTVTCNDIAVISGLDWTSAPNWNNPAIGTYSSISVTASSGNCSGKSATCSGTLTVQSNVVYGAPVTYEGETYETVVIGTQTWMARNLNYDVPDNDTDVCYDNDPANCAISGRLYNWATANTVCPSGWHLPTLLEWATLTSYVRDVATKLKARNGWTMYCGNGTDDYGFSALPGGAGTSLLGFLGGGLGYWWSATESSNAQASYIYINCNVGANKEGKSAQYSVRCVKD